MESANKVPKDKLVEAKEIIGVAAVKQLQKGVDIMEYENTKVEFGYIYLRDDGYEALFKVVTDKKVVYFAAQQGKIMRLQDTFNEVLFHRTIDGMISLHGSWM